jgi:hypothetical protein
MVGKIEGNAAKLFIMSTCYYSKIVLRIRIRDPVLFCAFMTPGSAINQKSGSGYGMNNPDNISESLETIFGLKILKFFDADPDPGSFWLWIRDGKIRVLDPV